MKNRLARKRVSRYYLGPGLIQLDADRGTEFDAFAGVGEFAVRLVDDVDFNGVGIAAGAQQVLSVRGYREIARMDARFLESGALDTAGLRIDTEDRDAVILEAMAGIKETAVRGEMDVCAAFAVAGIGLQVVDGGQFAIFIAENIELVAQFAQHIHEPAIRAEGGMARTGDVNAAELESQFIIPQLTAPATLETINRIGAQVIDEDIFAIRREEGLVDVRGNVVGPGRSELPVLRPKQAVRCNRERGHGTARIIGGDHMAVQQQDVARIGAAVGTAGGLPVQQVDAVVRQAEGIGALPAILELADGVCETAVVGRNDEGRIVAARRIQQDELCRFLIELV